MAKGLHATDFDDATQLKLAIFRGYIRKWIPVFFTAPKGGGNRETINLWDFFAGPGTDASGNPGSPRIIQDELKAYCETRRDLKADGVQVRLYFNDKSKKHVRQLQEYLAESSCPKTCCEAVYSSKPFQEAFAEYLPIMQRPRSANLVIMDQFGVKEVTPAVVQALAGCRATDILFFAETCKGTSDEPSESRSPRGQGPEIGGIAQKGSVLPRLGPLQENERPGHIFAQGLT